MRKIPALLLVCAVLGCSNSMVSRKDALAQIRHQTEINDHGLLVFVGRVGLPCPHPDRPDWNPEEDIGTIVARKAGYLTVASDGEGYWKLELTDKGRAFMKSEAVHFNSKQYGDCNFGVVNFPLVTKTISEVTGVMPEGNECRAEYKWHFKLTDLGRLLQEKGDVYLQLSLDERIRLGHRVGRELSLPVPDDPEIQLPNTGTAVFRKYDDGWRLQSL